MGTLNLPLLFSYKNLAVYRLPNDQYLLWDGRTYDTCLGVHTVLLFIQHELDGTNDEIPF